MTRITRNRVNWNPKKVYLVWFIACVRPVWHFFPSEKSAIEWAEYENNNDMDYHIIEAELNYQHPELGIRSK